jgi:hypothetical protein
MNIAVKWVASLKIQILYSNFHMTVSVVFHSVSNSATTVSFHGLANSIFIKRLTMRGYILYDDCQSVKIKFKVDLSLSLIN